MQAVLTPAERRLLLVPSSGKSMLSLFWLLNSVSARFGWGQHEHLRYLVQRLYTVSYTISLDWLGCGPQSPTFHKSFTGAPCV